MIARALRKGKRDAGPKVQTTGSEINKFWGFNVWRGDCS